MLGRPDTHDIAPMSHIFPVRNVLRADVAAPSMDRAVLLSGAPCPRRRRGVPGPQGGLR